MAFDNNKLGELRPNQIITTFGPGSIVDAVKDSVTVLDTNYWKEKGTKIIDGRLASYLGVDCFYMPRTSYGGDIPVVSFPYVHVCSKCGRLFDVRDNFDLDLYLRRESTVRIADGRRILLVLSLCVRTDIWMTFPGDGGFIKGIPTAKAN